jgi:hypothetical protein
VVAENLVVAKNDGFVGTNVSRLADTRAPGIKHAVDTKQSTLDMLHIVNQQHKKVHTERNNTTIGSFPSLSLGTAYRDKTLATNKKESAYDPHFSFASSIERVSRPHTSTDDGSPLMMTKRGRLFPSGRAQKKHWVMVLVVFCETCFPLP